VIGAMGREMTNVTIQKHSGRQCTQASIGSLFVTNISTKTSSARQHPPSLIPRVVLSFISSQGLLQTPDNAENFTETWHRNPNTSH
jgi:hypothetical protein